MIRPACNVVYGLAVVLETGLFNENEAGTSETQSLDRAIDLMKAVLFAHESNRSWGYTWQSALCAGLLGHGGWMLWDNLDADTQRRLAAVIEYEANRFLKYKVPYWTGRDDDGDTKAEENAWNSMVLDVAIAMMPSHPHVRGWKEKCSELVVSAYSLKTDLQNTSVLDGKPVKDWLNGYNLRDDGAAINHGPGFVHPDYMACITFQLRAYLTQSLAGQLIPEAADFNVDFMYRTFVTKPWDSPPYDKPGGTIYVPGKPGLYYPKGTDWSRLYFQLYYFFDAFAHTFRRDQGLPHPAADWMRIRAKRMLEMQARHADGHTWAQGEFDAAAGREQIATRYFADVFLLQWLSAQNQISKRGNWLSADDSADAGTPGDSGMAAEPSVEFGGCQCVFSRRTDGAGWFLGVLSAWVIQRVAAGCRSARRRRRVSA